LTAKQCKFFFAGRDAGLVRVPLSAHARIQLGPRMTLQLEVAAPPEIDHETVTEFNTLKPDEITDVVDPD